LDTALPLRLGFFLETLSPRASFYVFGRFYRGIDRNLAYTEGDFLERAATKTFPRAWEEYWEAEDEHQVLTDVAVARRCRDELRGIGVSNELIYAEMVAHPDGADPFGGWPFRRLHEQIRRPISGLSLLGFDISSPVPTFHSYLMNANLRHVPELEGLLNEHALVRAREAAEALMQTASDHPYARARVPAVIEIWLVD
jgi:hypothetical protein